jgi:hypothetical protein
MTVILLKLRKVIKIGEDSTAALVTANIVY